MKASRAMPLALGGLLLAGPAAAQAPAASPSPSRGQALYKTHCATCHGLEGHGDGPTAIALTVRPADLTEIQKRAGGRFPATRIYDVIDGRKPVKGHGGAGMPIWGDAFKTREEGYREAPVREKIAALVEYLKTIQRPATP